MKNVAQRNRVSKQSTEITLRDLHQELQMEKAQPLKRLAIDKIVVIRGQVSYYIMLVDSNKRVSIGIIKEKTSE